MQRHPGRLRPSGGIVPPWLLDTESPFFNSEGDRDVSSVKESPRRCREDVRWKGWE